MKPLTPEWIQKAEGDFTTALRKLRARTQFRALTAFAIEVRYPGAFADKAIAREAVTFCREIRHRVRLSLDLES